MPLNGGQADRLYGRGGHAGAVDETIAKAVAGSHCDQEFRDPWAVTWVKRRLPGFCFRPAAPAVAPADRWFPEQAQDRAATVPPCVQRPKSSTCSDGCRAPVPSHFEHLFRPEREQSRRGLVMVLGIVRNGARNGSQWCSRSSVATHEEARGGARYGSRLCSRRDVAMGGGARSAG